MLGPISTSDGRWEHFFGGSSPTAASLRQAILACKNAVPVDSHTGTPLAADLLSFGASTPKLQKALTRALDKAAEARFSERMLALPRTHQSRIAWLNCDVFSSVWVTAWPSPECAFSPSQFREITARYFGAPSPACQGYVGCPIPGGSTLDAHGNSLTSARLPGDHFRTRHDAVKWTIDYLVTSMGGSCTTEVYGLFAALLSQAARNVTEREWTERQRQGILPDFLLDCPPIRQLAELKSISMSRTWYGRASTVPCHAVRARAEKIPGEYRRKAVSLDQRFNNTPPGVVGPVEARLNELGPTIGSLAFGMHGEVSPDLHQLVHTLASLGAEKHYRTMLASSPAHAKGALVWHVRRHLGGAILRANADLLLGRLGAVGGGLGAATIRRQRARRAAWGAHHGPSDAMYAFSRSQTSHAGQR